MPDTVVQILAASPPEVIVVSASPPTVIEVFGVGPQGPPGSGVIVLVLGPVEDVPPGTPANTVIVRRSI